MRKPNSFTKSKNPWSYSKEDGRSESLESSLLTLCNGDGGKILIPLISSYWMRKASWNDSSPDMGEKSWDLM
jgi:hypothetical protein